VAIERYSYSFAFCGQMRWNKCKFVINNESEVNTNVVFKGMQIEFAVSDVE
jgi:hypothetical protein